MKAILLIGLLAVAVWGAWTYDNSKSTPPAQAKQESKARRSVQLTPTPEPTKPSVRPQGKPAPKKVKARIERIADEVEKVRGLKLSKPVDVRFLTRKEMGVRYQIDLQKEWPLAQQEADESMLIAFGYMTPRSKLSRLAEQSTGDAFAGFYEPDTKDLFIIGKQNDMGIVNRLTIAHELTHAAQDQAFDLGKMMDAAEDNDDRMIALKSLVEGDARFSEMLYLGKQKYDEADLYKSPEEESLLFTSYEEAPPVYGLTLVFPYEVGSEWVGSLYKSGGWKAVNAAYKRPPQSSEQILHPEKYVQNDQPENVKVPDMQAALGKKWRKVVTNTLGEYKTLILLGDAQTVDPTLMTASDGWEGDRYDVYKEKEGDGVALVWRTLWESDKDAKEFTTALAAQQLGLNGDVFGSKMKQKKGVLTLDGTAVSVRIRRTGKEVRMVVTRETDDKLIDRLVAKALR